MRYVQWIFCMYFRFIIKSKVQFLKTLIQASKYEHCVIKFLKVIESITLLHLIIWICCRGVKGNWVTYSWLLFKLFIFIWRIVSLAILTIPHLLMFISNWWKWVYMYLTFFIIEILNLVSIVVYVDISKRYIICSFMMFEQ